MDPAESGDLWIWFCFYIGLPGISGGIGGWKEKLKHTKSPFTVKPVKLSQTLYCV